MPNILAKIGSKSVLPPYMRIKVLPATKASFSRRANNPPQILLNRRADDMQAHRVSVCDTRNVRLLTQTNPHRAHTKSWVAFEILRQCRTVKEYVKSVRAVTSDKSTMGYLNWAVNHQYAKLTA